MEKPYHRPPRPEAGDPYVWMRMMNEVHRARSEGGVSSIPALTSVERAGWGAVALLTLVFVALLERFPGAHRTVEETILRAGHAVSAAAPLHAVQGMYLNDDLQQLLLAVTAVALWFRDGADRRIRPLVLVGFAAALPAIVLARVFDQIVHRPSPNHAALGTFPSEYCALMAIATVVAFTLQRRAGLGMAAALIIAGAYRVAIGANWPSDVVGGALLGTLLAVVMLRFEQVHGRAIEDALAFARARPALTYAVAFAFLVEFAQSFRDVNALALSLAHSASLH